MPLAEKRSLQEAELMKRFRHPNLVQLLGLCRADGQLMMVLEFLAGGALDDWVYSHGAGADPRTLLGFLHQTAMGMMALGEAERTGYARCEPRWGTERRVRERVPMPL